MGMKELWYYTGDLPRFQNAQIISSNLNFKDKRLQKGFLETFKSYFDGSDKNNAL